MRKNSRVNGTIVPVMLLAARGDMRQVDAPQSPQRPRQVAQWQPHHGSVAIRQVRYRRKARMLDGVCARLVQRIA